MVARDFMNPVKRPVSVTVLACLYLAVGTLGFVGHGLEFLRKPSFQYEIVWIELTEALAILCGAFLLKGQNWARWLAVAWMAFHVVLSAFNAIGEFLIHLVFCAIIAWLLFRPVARRYFSGPKIEAARLR